MNKYTVRPYTGRGYLTINGGERTHCVYRDDMPVWSGNEQECEQFADRMNYQYALNCMVKGTAAEKL